MSILTEIDAYLQQYNVTAMKDTLGPAKIYQPFGDILDRDEKIRTLFDQLHNSPKFKSQQTVIDHIAKETNTSADTVSRLLHNRQGWSDPGFQAEQDVNNKRLAGADFLITHSGKSSNFIQVVNPAAESRLSKHRGIKKLDNGRYQLSDTALDLLRESGFKIISKR